MFNYMFKFVFATIIFKSHMFKVSLYIFIKIQWKHEGFHNETLKKKTLTFLCSCCKTTILKIWI